MLTAPVSAGPVTLCRVDIEGDIWYRTSLAGVLICNTQNLAEARAAYRRLSGGVPPTAIPTMKLLKRRPAITLSRVVSDPTAPFEAPPEAAAEETMVFKTPWGEDFEVSPAEWERIQHWLQRSRGQSSDPDSSTD